MDQDKTEGKPQKKILYVEDEENIRTVVKEFFQTIGYDIVSAEEGNEALKYFLENKNDKTASSKFALVITDINMPNGMGGIELIKEIHKTDQAIPIIAISGYLKNSDYIKDLPSDVSYYQKPVSLKELNKKIQEYL